MLDAESGGVGGSGGGSDLERGVDALKKFHSQVTALLRDFEGGEGGSTKVAEQRVSRGSFSGAQLAFAEADGFFTQYNRVHRELVSLSKTLGDQIEMLTIGVHAADVGFDNVEEDMRSRFHTIQSSVEQERAVREAQRPTAPAEKSAEREQARDNDTALPTDLG
ncbi:hypothetical protein GCM10010232_10100 [Streptomyces amakusaensis]|uniref:Uncharacterized protein n=1 Tax=Streptomyces amakusaensis TaxID=67271 RepID=A0ABW0AS08_9ACTN